jgi:hypothetical protein
MVGIGLTTLNQRRISVGKATVEFPFFSRRWARYGITTVGFSVPRQRRVRFDRPTVGFSSFHLDCRFAYTNPTLVQRRQADADLHPTITIFYRRWFDVTLQTGNTMHSSTKNYLYAYMLGGK